MKSTLGYSLKACGCSQKLSGKSRAQYTAEIVIGDTLASYAHFHDPGGSIELCLLVVRPSKIIFRMIDTKPKRRI